MILRWEQGRERVDALIAQGQLERVIVDRTLAELYIEHARRHLTAAQSILDQDATGSFQLAYDAARKGLAAVLQNQGLRSTSRGGHKAIEEALRAQLVPPLAVLLNRFGWMRTLRNGSEYPSFDRPVADRDDAVAAHATAHELLDKAEQLLDQMPLY